MFVSKKTEPTLLKSKKGFTLKIMTIIYSNKSRTDSRMIPAIVRGVFSILLLAAATLTSEKAAAQSTQYWNTSEGELQLQSQGNSNYRGSFRGNILLGIKSNNGNFLGHWINSRRNTLRCRYPVNGSFYWGAVSLKFNANSFRGKFGICDYSPGAEWTGTIKMTASGNSGLNLSGFFTPAYNKQFTTTFGTLTFNNSNGQTRTGNYGNGYGSLTITRSYWREAPRQETELHGTFSNREGNQGGFTLNFESECVFSGEYWYNGQTNQKYPWHGICSSGKPRPAGGWGCKALTASCLAQSSGMLVEEYCVKNPTTLGCPFKNRR